MLSRHVYVLSLVVIVVAFISLVVLEGLRYWFEVRMERERRLLEKCKYDFISRQIERGQIIGKCHYEITIVQKFDAL